jgi:predicted NAD/FAD-dependent oxidoreductase
VGRIVGNKTVFVVEASPLFSSAFADAPSETYLPDLVRRHEEIWSIPAGQISAAYGHSWKFARPVRGGKRYVTPPAGGFICGDSRCEPTVENVWLDGNKAAQEVISYLAKHSG